MHLMQVAIQPQLILGDPQRVLLELLCVIFHLQVASFQYVYQHVSEFEISSSTFIIDFDLLTAKLPKKVKGKSRCLLSAK